MSNSALLIRKNKAESEKKKREYYFSDIVFRNSEYNLTRPTSKLKPLLLMLPYSIFDVSSVLNRQIHPIFKNQTGLIFFGSFSVTRHLRMIQQAQNNDLRPVSNQFVFRRFRGPTLDRSESFVLVQQLE